MAMTFSKLHLAVVGVLIALPAQAQTETAQVTTGNPPATTPAPPPTPVPPAGGHLGVAIPIVTVASDSTVIFDDFFDLGLAPGITIPFNRCWSFDFEFVAYDHFKSRRGPTTFVLDPG